MADHFSEFFTKFTEEAQEEAERLEKQQDNDGKNQDLGGDYDDIEDRNDVDIGILENIDELKSNISGIRDSVETRQRNIETEIRNLMTKEKAEYIKNVQKRINEKNRKNVQNIINFISGERKYWDDKKNVQIDEDETPDAKELEIVEKFDVLRKRVSILRLERVHACHVEDKHDQAIEVLTEKDERDAALGV